LRGGRPAEPPRRIALISGRSSADDSAWIAATKAPTNTVLLDASLATDFLAHALRSTHKLI